MVSLRPLRLGLTGGIGSGKSTVAKRLADHGAAIIDADAIAQAVTAPGGAAITHISQAFGAGFITPTGALDRQRMRELVFADASAKLRLEAIVHPLVGQETQRRADIALAGGAKCIVFDIPLLVESGRWRTQLDRVMVIDCQAATQVARVVARSQLAPAAIEAIIAAQASRHQRLACADIVVFNDGISLSQLHDHVDALAIAFGLSSRPSA